MAITAFVMRAAGLVLTYVCGVTLRPMAQKHIPSAEIQKGLKPSIPFSYADLFDSLDSTRLKASRLEP